MKKNQTAVWKQASEVYADLSELSVQQALQHLYGIKDLSAEVKNAVITLINSGSQASQYFQDNLLPSFNSQLNDRINIGHNIDGYEILEKLGQGGMSQVFRAKRVTGEPQKQVAIKVFVPKSNAKELLQHFITEQQILARFSHPHIVDMLHGGTTSDDTAYLVMALLEDALPLDQFCKKNNSSVKQKIQFIAQCADALVYSHANLIIHRDIKPDNILIDKNQQLKIVDFGIAKLINNDIQGNKTTIMALTPNYAAPEQINSANITVQTDVFSLAIVALDVLSETDQNPLPQGRLIKSCVDDQVHLDTLIKSLKIDKDLKNILHKASQVKPANRYRNMQLFSEDLNNWLAQKPVKATAPSMWYELSKFAKRRSALFAAMLTFILTLILAIVFQTLQYHKTMAAQQEATQVKDFMLDVFSYANPEENIGQKLSALDLLSLAQEDIKYKDFTDDALKSNILSHMGQAFVNMGGFKKGEANLIQALSLNPDNIDAQINLIALYLDTSQPEKAQPYFKQAQALIKQSKSDYAPQQAQLTLLKAENSTFNKNDQQGVNLAKKAQQQFTNLNDVQGVLKSTRVLTEKMFALKESKQPIAIAQKIISATQQKTSPVNTELLRLKTTVAWMYSRIGELTAALTLIDEVILNMNQTLGNKHPALIDALIQRANINKDLGHIEAALKDAKDSYKAAQSVFGETSQYAQQGLSVIAQLEFVSGDRQQAQNDLQKVVAMSVKNYGATNRMTLSAQMELTNYMAANGELESAIKLAQSTRASLIENVGDKNPQTLFATNVLLKLLSQQAVDADTISMAVKNNQNIIAVLGIKHPQAAFSFFVLGNIYQRAQQYDKANEAFKAIIDNKLVPENSPRFVALTQAISKNYQAIEQFDLAIEFAKKSKNAADSAFGSEANRSLEASLFLLQLLQETKNPAYHTLLQALKDKAQAGKITDAAMIEKINALK